MLREHVWLATNTSRDINNKLVFHASVWFCLQNMLNLFFVFSYLVIPAFAELNCNRLDSIGKADDTPQMNLILCSETSVYAVTKYEIHE